MKKSDISTISIKPVSQAMDTRALPDVMRSNGLRFSQNFSVEDQQNLCRLQGFERLFNDTTYVNDDLHDQLLGLQNYYDDLGTGVDPTTITSWPDASCGSTLLTRPNGREPITLLFEAVSDFDTRVLFAGTQSRIYTRNPSTRNWRIIADGYGGDASSLVTGRKFRAACLHDKVFFTNNYDDVLVHTLFQNADGCNIQAVSTVPDLISIGLRQAKVVKVWKGLTILMNVLMDGSRRANRVVWSDFNNGMSWAPANNSIAGFQDLGQQEEIINAEEMGDYLFIYTTRGIWQAYATGAAGTPITFSQFYRNSDGHKCLVYPDSLVNAGIEHYYLSHDGVYKFTYYYPEPTLVTWIHQSSNLIYDDLAVSACCDPVIATYWSEKKAILFSWPSATSANCVNDKTIAFFTEFQGASYIDHGFTAFARVSRNNEPTFRDFLVRYCICQSSDAELTAPKEARGDCSSFENPGCAIVPTSFWNPDPVYGQDPPMEDFTAPMAANSLCAVLGNLTIDDLCASCGESQVMAGVSGKDWAIKQLGTAFSRQICTNPTAVGTVTPFGYCSAIGTYTYSGYTSRLVLGPLDFGKPELLKRLVRVMPMLYPEFQLTPCVCRLRIGVSRIAEDPLDNPACSITWRAVDDIVMQCPNPSQEADLEAANLQTWDDFHRECYEEGKFLYLDLTVVNADGTPAVGGAVCISRVDFKGKTVENRI